MNLPEAPGFEPRRGWLLATVLFIAAALTLCWPMLRGQLINGSDFYLAGWAFRHYGAEYWRQHHAIPLWNPYIFGGLPYVAAAHGDVFYPTAWLRWLLPLASATNLTFGGHIVLAGISMYALLRGLKLSWGAAVTGGLAYELSGIVASMVHPGHDGKLFVCALAPFLFLGLLRGVRGRSLAGYGGAALAVGLALLGHPQLGYYLLVAAGIWTLYLVFWDEAGPRGGERYRALGWSALAAALGIAIYSIQLLPLLGYLPYSPRGAGGPSGGWEYATRFAMPPAELFTTFYPQLNGMNDAYAGSNGFKLHTEYLGVVVLLLALCGLGGQERKRERWALCGIAALFLLVAFGGHTPFYRLWYDVMPTQKSVRAVGSAFYLVALVVCVLAGYGAERIFRGQVAPRRVLIGAGVFGVLGLFGAIGALGGLAQSLADPQLIQIAMQNAPEIQSGGLRVLLFSLGGVGVLLAVRRGKMLGSVALAAVLLMTWGDLWSIDRRFFEYGQPDQLFGDDTVTTTLRKTTLPFRVWDPREAYGALAVYPGSWLMGRDVPQLLGYHGNELANFDVLLGGKNNWAKQVSPALLQLFAVRYVLFRNAQKIPGYHQILGPVTTANGSPAVLYEADTVPPYARLMSGAVKVPDAQGADAVSDLGLLALEVAVYPDSSDLKPADLAGKVPAPATARATVAQWEPGKMRISIEGRDERSLYLVVGENWYKDWITTIDGRPAPTLRAQHTLLSAVIPPGAREVRFEFRSRDYQRGRVLSLLGVIGAVLLLLGQRIRRPAAANG